MPLSPPSPGRLRVCLIAPHFAEYALALAQALQTAGAQVLLVASRENLLAEIGPAALVAAAGGPELHLIHKSRNPLSLLLQALRLVAVVRRFAPQVLHVQEDSKDVLAAALPWLPKVPLLLTMHDPKPHSGDDTRVRTRTRHGIYIEQLRRRADAALVHGQRLVADARQVLGGRQRPVHVVPHGPLGQALAASQNAEQEAGRCLFFGRIEAYKGLRHFIEMVRRLRAQGVMVRGVVAGRGSDLEPNREALRDAQAFELIERFLSPEEVVREFQRARVVVMPYDNATQSGVAAYAIGVGRGVVAFDVGALCEMVDNGRTGLLVPHGDMPALMAAVQRVVQDDGLAQHLQEQARARADGEFSWPSIATRTLAAYADMAAARG
ncbi:MAG: glycosyltransferase family 4 protein [Burkholderiaceae bacterium]|nr:glycosyltransferase family 4 protein [Burkholderiaceae bacterium]